VACEDFCPAGFEILRLHPALVLRVAAREDNTSWCARGSATYIELSLIVSSAINAMSTVQAAQTANHSPLFDLPRELRDLIYEQVFADLISAMESLLRPARARSGIALDVQSYLLGIQELLVQFMQPASNRDR
jgi:hypothetical protein